MEIARVKINKMSELTDEIKGNWNEIKGKVKQKYADITDDDLLKAKGKKDELVGIIQQKTGKAKSEVKEFIDNL